jgi:hypothetical protein
VIGDQFFSMAVAWTAAQRVGADVGVIIAAQYAALIVSGLFAGVFADRWDRRRTLIAVDLLRAACGKSTTNAWARSNCVCKPMVRLRIEVKRPCICTPVAPQKDVRSQYLSGFFRDRWKNGCATG